jgi:ABC-type Fe3+/spermidine/putrescine transport system ATPase subunit
MVFQNYALWPHMTALENVAFPLEMRGTARRAAADRAHEMLALVELTGVASRRPGQMSGGEQQRVALARALAARPAILLLDECLSNLDARLRETMAGEMQRIQRAAGLTAVYVTHDPGEAFLLSDRIAVLDEGRIQQVDQPAAVYARPRTPRVGAALGPLNVLRAAQAVEFGLLARGRSHPDALLGVRPEHVRLISAVPGGDERRSGADGRIQRVAVLGGECYCWVQLGRSDELRARLEPGQAMPAPGDLGCVSVDAEDWVVLEED